MSTRQEYVKKLKAKLDVWSAEIDALEAKALQTQAQVRQNYLDQVVDLKSRREEAEQHLVKLQDSSEAAWHTLKEGADRVMDHVTSTWQETKKAFWDGLKSD